MKGGTRRCGECGEPVQRTAGSGVKPGPLTCASCGASVDASALSEFTRRLARFGLGDTKQPLLSRLPGMPDAK